MRQATRRAWLVVVLILVSVATASAECAWVLWARPEEWVSNDIEARDEGQWEPRSAYATLKQCVEAQEAEAQSDRPDARIWRECLYAPERPRSRRQYSWA